MDLTETEAEYVVQVVKHIYPDHVLLQFNITNYMEGQVLQNVVVDIETNGEWMEEVFAITITISETLILAITSNQISCLDGCASC